MVISKSVSVAANTLSTNVLAGEQFEFIPGRRALVKMRACTTATGINASMQIGGESILNDALVSFANRFPVTPDDELVGSSGRGGERLFLTFRNTTAGALTVTYVVEIVPF